MRLIGGHDYYDNGLAYGRDESITFVRKKSSLPENTFRGIIPGVNVGTQRLEIYDLKRERLYTYWGHQCHPLLGRDDYILRRTVVLFAGKRYNGYRFVSADRKTDMWFWTYQALADFLATHGLAFDTEFKAWKDNRTSDEKVRAFFDSEMTPDTYEWMMEQRASVVFASYGLFEDSHDTYVNHTRFNARSERKPYEIQIDTDCLGNIEFYRILNPVQAFQELSMWIGGVLPKPGPVMVEITDDKVKAAKHGMDKWSFRKLPEK